MKIRAYQEMYLSRVQSKLGGAFDYAINTCKMAGQDFIDQFVVSTISRRMENGEPAIIAGRSGIELALDVILETTGISPEDFMMANTTVAGTSTASATTVGSSSSLKVANTTVNSYKLGRSCEYWIGWAVAYYQWCSSRRFLEIFKALPFAELQKMYRTLHEADVSKFADIADRRLREYFKDTNLKRIRTAYGCTQAALAERSGATLRSIQMYEQRRKDINKASAETLYRISKVLGCTIESLLEK